MSQKQTKRSGEFIKNPVIREFYGETAKERATAQAQIISKGSFVSTGGEVTAQKGFSTEPQKAPDTSTVGNVVKGAAKSTASGWVNTGGTLLELLGKVGGNCPLR